jgi:hypothetical protein
MSPFLMQPSQPIRYNRASRRGRSEGAEPTKVRPANLHARRKQASHEHLSSHAS